MSSFRHLSRSVRQLSQRTFTRKFITLGKLLSFWPDIVGAELAAKSYPIAVSFRKVDTAPRSKEKNFRAVLEIAASSAEATLLVYQKPLILERIKTLLGDAQIVDIKLIHDSHMVGLQPHLPLTQPPKKALSTGSETALPSLAEIDDDALASALRSLGRWINP